VRLARRAAKEVSMYGTQGGGGEDKVHGLAATDELCGGFGEDVMYGSPVNDLVDTVVNADHGDGYEQRHAQRWGWAGNWCCFGVKCFPTSLEPQITRQHPS
jgi:hypothetical protein